MSALYFVAGVDAGSEVKAQVHFFVLILRIFSTLFCTFTLFCKNVYHF